MKKADPLLKLKKKFKERCLTEPDFMEPYHLDESGEKGLMPLAVIFPLTTEEVSFTAKTCYQAGMPLFLRGTGTGKTGGMLLTQKGVLLSLEKMQKLSIEPENMLAVCEPGVINAELQREARKHGLFYPVDPASYEMSSIGGNVAENAGVPRAFKYGVTRDYVLGLEFVLPDGTVIESGGKTRKNVTGYNLKDLIIGSEGTLAIVTKIKLKLIPYPKERFLLWGILSHFSEAFAAINKVYASGIMPSCIEFIESRAFKAVERFTGKTIPYADYSSHLYIEIDGSSSDAVRKDSEAISRILYSQNAKHVMAVPYENKQEELWNLRRIISEATKSLAYNKKSEDIVVPPAKLTEFFNRTAEIEKKSGIEIICFGHLGDGNVHVNLLNLSDKSSKAWKKNIDKTVLSIFEAARELNGTLSGEHGIGLTKKKYIGLFLSQENLSIHRQLKKLFDRKNLLNPGKIW